MLEYILGSGNMISNDVIISNDEIGDIIKINILLKLGSLEDSVLLL